MTASPKPSSGSKPIHAPPESKKLAGTAVGWRLRVGDYRVLYDIADAVRIVRVYRVRHRKDVYR